MPAPHDQVAALTVALERTMRDLRVWSEPPPPLRPFAKPFAMDTMPFEHWLQLVLVPRLREIAAGQSALPPRSNLAAHAVREFDGRDALDPLIDVLRQIDELSPDPIAQSTGVGGRRLGASLALALLVTGWTVLALWATQHLTSSLGHFFPATVIQTFTGSIAPGTDFQPLSITVAGTVTDDGTTRATEISFMLLRSLRTMRQGPTAPLDFAATEPPTLPAVLEWLADFGVDRHADAATQAAAQALAVVTGASSARTTAALHDVPATLTTPVTADPLTTLASRTPEWFMLLASVVVILTGAIPITIAVVRMGRRRLPERS